mgnify:CR=1 FL=1
MVASISKNDAGARVVIVEKETEPLSEASSANTGHLTSCFYRAKDRGRIHRSNLDFSTNFSAL